MRESSPVPVRIPQALGTLLLAVVLCSCNLMIPENPSAPRYNSLLGPPRAPQMNPGGTSPSSSAPRTVNREQAAAFPPVDAPTEMRAQEILAADVPPPMGMPIATAPVRQMPSENNGSGMQMAQSQYPDLHSVPAAPVTGPQGDAARLARVRAQLEADRAAADASRRQLAIDAAAEPSLLNEPPIQPIPAPGPQSMMRPSPTGGIALPPPPPPMAQASGTSWDRAAPSFAAAPMSAPAMEPIVLRAPAVAPAPAPSFSYASTPAPYSPPVLSMEPAMAGGFNPMAGAEPITLRAPTSYAGGTAYLPNSRYSTRRN